MAKNKNEEKAEGKNQEKVEGKNQEKAAKNQGWEEDPGGKKGFLSSYRITNGKKFQLKDIDPGDTGHRSDDEKEAAKAALSGGLQMLSALQSKLYAQGKWGVLLIFQAMDAAGKDGCIKHVMSGVNPQGCAVASFKAPSSEELSHDFMWRCYKELPARGHIGIFNRSYYEEVLVARVHPTLLERQNIPPKLITKSVWEDRYEDIGNFERYLTRNGFVILKFFLHVSKEEQKKRFMERLDDPEKNWKFSASDLSERARWDEYAKAYEDMICATASKEAPWYVVPADNKWFTREVVAAAIIDTLSKLDLEYPTVSDETKKELAIARIDLMNEKDDKKKT